MQLINSDQEHLLVLVPMPPFNLVLVTATWYYEGTFPLSYDMEIVDIVVIAGLRI